MAKIFIRRSDGVIQRYKVNAKRMKDMTSSLEVVRYHKLSRTRRIYYKEFAVLKREKPSGIISKRSYRKVDLITTNSPISSMDRDGKPFLAQIHVRLKGIKGNRTATVDGYSHLNDPNTKFDRMRRQAIEHACSQLPFYADDIQEISLDYVYFTPKAMFNVS